MSALVLATADLHQAVVAAPAVRPRTGASPQRVAIYYGYPSLVNGADEDLSRAVAVFSAYDVIVLGDGLEFDTAGADTAGPEEHQFTRQLIEKLHLMPRRGFVYGYVDLGRTQRLSLDEIDSRIERWARMGAQGVFFDEAGYDFGVTRKRQNAAIAAAHARRLGAIDAGDRLVGGQLVARRAKDLGDGYRHRRHDGVGVGRPKQADERFADDRLRVAGRLYDASRQSGRRRDSRDDQNRHDAGAGCGRMAV